MTSHRLLLFIAGLDGGRGQRAVEDLTALCTRHLGQAFDLQVVDVLVQPDVAEQHKVLATPCAIRLEPLPVLRIVGDLRDGERVAEALEIGERSTADREETTR